MDGTFTMLQPREQETPFNKAPVVRAVTALLMVIFILSTLTRAGVRMATTGSLKADDYLIGISTVLGFCEAVVIIFAGANGLGKHDSTLHDAQISYILKSTYAATTLFMVSLGFAKLSAALTVLNVAPLDRRRVIQSTIAGIILWTITSTITALFQCHLPKPWDYISGKCINNIAFSTWFSIGNIITDLTIVGAMVELIWKIQAPRSKKILVVGMFASRILTIPVIILQAIIFNRAMRSIESTRDTFDMWLPTVIMQAVQCLSITATCVPYLKPFLDSLESGQMRAGEAFFTSMRTKSASGNSKNKSDQASKSRYGKISKTITSSAGTVSGASDTHKEFELADIANPKGTMATTTVTAHDKRHGSWDGQSHSSQTVLVQQTWRVDVEKKPDTTE